jgi:hypothetical protein
MIIRKINNKKFSKINQLKKMRKLNKFSEKYPTQLVDDEMFEEILDYAQEEFEHEMDGNGYVLEADVNHGESYDGFINWTGGSIELNCAIDTMSAFERGEFDYISGHDSENEISPAEIKQSLKTMTKMYSPEALNEGLDWEVIAKECNCGSAKQLEKDFLNGEMSDEVETSLRDAYLDDEYPCFYQLKIWFFDKEHDFGREDPMRGTPHCTVLAIFNSDAGYGLSRGENYLYQHSIDLNDKDAIEQIKHSIDDAIASFPTLH